MSTLVLNINCMFKILINDHSLLVSWTWDLTLTFNFSFFFLKLLYNSPIRVTFCQSMSRIFKNLSPKFWQNSKSQFRFSRNFSGYLHSPNYPLAYPREADCTYIITTNQGSGLNIYVDDFHLDAPHPDFGCQSDWLQIFDGPKARFVKFLKIKIQLLSVCSWKM